MGSQSSSKLQQKYFQEQDFNISYCDASIFQPILPVIKVNQNHKRKVIQSEKDVSNIKYSLRLDSGQKYKGQMKQISQNDQIFYVADGQGFIQIRDQQQNRMYQGKIKDGRPNGKGLYQTNFFSYLGEFYEGFYSGKGLLKDNQQFTYYGEFMKGKKHGIGCYKTNDFKIKCQWKYDKIDGLTIIETNKGCTYQGEIKNGKIEGYGKKQFISNNSDSQVKYYEGQMRNNLPQGFGFLKQGFGYEYVGQWKQGKKQGEGYQQIKLKNSILKNIGIFENNKIKHQRQIQWMSKINIFKKQPYKYFTEKNPLQNIEQLNDIDSDDGQDEHNQSQIKNHLQLLFY